MTLTTVALLFVTLSVTGQAGCPPVDPATTLITEAQARMQAGDLQAALSKLEDARTLGTRPVPVAWCMATVQARLGNRDAAFAELTLAASAGAGALPPQMAGDPAIVALKSGGPW